MGLSNQIPSSRIAQAGVVADTASRPVSPYEGQLIYQLDTNQLLVWNGSAWVAPNSTTANPPGLELITGVGCSAGGTASNGVITVNSGISTVSVTNAFNSSYDNYKIMMSKIDIDTAAAFIFFTLTGVNSGYYSVYSYQAASSATPSYNRINNGAYWVLAYSSRTDDGAVDMTVFNPNRGFRTNATWMASMEDVFGYGGGMQANNEPYTGFTLNMSSGNFNGGTIRVYGYRN
jgi:hypothetical protein